MVRNSVVFMKENQSNPRQVVEELKNKIKDSEDMLILNKQNNA